MRKLATGFLVAALGCGKREAGSEPPTMGATETAHTATPGPIVSAESAANRAAAPGKRGLGSVMVDVARRFELAGRAAVAGRFELAEYEADELGELFEADVPGASLPAEGPTGHIPAMTKAFAETTAPDLKKAAAAKDRAAFAAAFGRTAAACNTCHQASAKGFIEVPAQPGKSVPVLDAPAPPRSGPPAATKDVVF